MSNKLIVAAAGSGKTTHLINEALKITDSKVLITTFTEANEREIKKKFYEINGCIPKNINIQTWFSFLIQHGVKPYQSFIYEGDIKGLYLTNKKSGFRGYIKRTGQPSYYAEKDVENYYFTKTKLIYSDKLSKFVIKVNELSHGLVLNRIGLIYSNIFIDEVQDLSGYDLDILKLLFKIESNIVLVGDPRQVTYHTHEESRNKTYSNGGIVEFVENECKDCLVEIDDTTLNKTFRNNQLICEFANSIYPDFKPCDCNGQPETGHDGVFFVSPLDVDDYLESYRPIQLRESSRTSVNLNYDVMNFGESKGLTFDRVLIYPTSKNIDWILDNSKELKPKSKSKFYVAVTRAKYSVGIVYDNKKETIVKGIEKYKV